MILISDPLFQRVRQISTPWNPNKATIHLLAHPATLVAIHEEILPSTGRAREWRGLTRPQLPNDSFIRLKEFLRTTERELPCDIRSWYNQFQSLEFHTLKIPFESRHECKMLIKYCLNPRFFKNNNTYLKRVWSLLYPHFMFFPSIYMKLVAVKFNIILS